MDNLIFNNVVVTIREITPANAVNILDAKNTKNRNMSKTKIDEYVSAMKAGEWVFNGDSIRISNSGVLLDGQHRLTALAKSGINQHFIVIENMDAEVGLTIDTGKNRDGGDVLAIESGVNKQIASSISGAIKIFNRHENSRKLHNTGTGKLTNVRMIEEYNKHKDLVKFCCKWMDENIKKQGAILSRSETLGTLLILCDIDSDEAIKFCEMVFCGLGINEECPQSFLRDYLLSCKLDSKKANQAQRLHTIIKTWNSLRSGRKITTARNIVFYAGRDTFKKAI